MTYTDFRYLRAHRVRRAVPSDDGTLHPVSTIRIFSSVPTPGRVIAETTSGFSGDPFAVLHRRRLDTRGPCSRRFLDVLGYRSNK